MICQTIKQKHFAHKELIIIMIDVEIPKEPVELYKVLKFENLVASGGEAKLVISEGLVLLNGEIETRKRKKIVSGDVVEFAGETLHIKLGSTT
tara:strand:- start:2765 stop:3043 length:279 start_codon:yes stop_codon:yes gene_type:complete